MERHRGPLIDPPAPQSDYRPCGVYRYPDPRACCEGRTIFECWDASGQCLTCASVHPAAVTPALEATFWAWLDDVTDRREVVNAPSLPVARPTHLRAL